MASLDQNQKNGFSIVSNVDYEKYKRELPDYKFAYDLMSKNIETTKPDMCLDDAAALMGTKHIGSLIVMKYHTPVGIVTERDLLTKVIALGLFLQDEKVEDIMSYPLSGISLSTKIEDVAKQMMKKKGRLGVFDAGELVGIITASDLIKSLPNIFEEEIRVDDLMTAKVVTADKDTSVLDVAKTMGRQRIGSVIITKNGKPFGIFTERDLLTNFLATGKQLFTPVGAECSSPITVIPSGLSVHQAATIMALRHLRRLPVVKNNDLIGILTARDLVEAYSK